MKFQIVRHVPAEKVACHVRPEFHAFLPQLASHDQRFTLILFRFQQDEKHSGVVLSSSVKQALARLGDAGGEKILAFAGTFTLEAKAAIRTAGADAITLKDSSWTDESYKEIRGPRK